jgi:PAS domain S-box-containing protein
MASARPASLPATQTNARGANTDAVKERSLPAEDHAVFVSPAGDLLTVIGRDGCFKRVAPAFLPAFGYVEVELLERAFLSFIHPADTVATRAALDQLAQGQPTLGLENRFRCKDGSYRRLAWTAIPTPGGLLYAVARDITEQGRPDDERRRSLARDQAIALAQKEELLAAVCHDLQQPLTVILAQTQLIQRQLARGGTLTEGQLATRLTHIFVAATRMRGMTQDLVDASLHEAGRPLALLLARTELVALTRQAVGEHQLISAVHQFVFEAEVAVLEATVDETRMHRVLANLLANAIKYSPKGGPVRVTVKESAEPDGKSALLVVREEGVGIPPQDVPHVFDRFHRGANVIGRFAGTGPGPRKRS